MIFGRRKKVVLELKGVELQAPTTRKRSLNVLVRLIEKLMLLVILVAASCSGWVMYMEKASQ